MKLCVCVRVPAGAQVQLATEPAARAAGRPLGAPPPFAPAAWRSARTLVPSSMWTSQSMPPRASAIRRSADKTRSQGGGAGGRRRRVRSSAQHLPARPDRAGAAGVNPTHLLGRLARGAARAAKWLTALRA